MRDKVAILLYISMIYTKSASQKYLFAHFFVLTIKNKKVKRVTLFYGDELYHCQSFLFVQRQFSLLLCVCKTVCESSLITLFEKELEKRTDLKYFTYHFLLRE